MGTWKLESTGGAAIPWTAALPQIPMNPKTDLETENSFCYWSTGILPVLENGPPACSSK
jgi:hypothetical protein